MMDEREDRFDEFLRDAASQGYNAPPPAPRAEMWERIRAERARPVAVTPLKRPTVRVLLALAAILILGVAIGRFTAPSVVPTAVPGTVTAASGNTPAGVDTRKERGELASKLATTDHLTQVETFLTEFNSQPVSPEFSVQAKDLLSTTRLLLDSKRVADPRTRKLLEDLELILVQIATLDPKDRGADLNSIADGLAQNQLRTRLRNAIPAGPAIKL